MRRYVIVLGTMFNNITILRLDPDSSVEVKRIKVPISYGPKDKYVTRLQSDPDLLKPVQTILPRMSFYMTNMTYDAPRAQNKLLRVAKGDNASRVSSQYMGVPYDFNFELVVYSKTIDDNNHIIEQILPHFNPDYTVTITPVPQIGFLKDIPIILNSVNPDVTYEGDWQSVRYVITTLSLTVKGYLFGPISTPKIIRKSIANIFNDPSLITGYIVRINTGTGNGVFKIQDTVYQGGNYNTANAYGTVLDWDETNNKLMIGGAQGNFAVNNTVRAVSSNAAYVISSFDASPLKLSQITVEPDPIDAEPTDDYGYTETVVEFPDTLD